MRTTIDLPDPLFRELKVQAALQQKKLKDLITAYLQAGLYSPQELSSQSRPSRSPLPIARRSTGHLIPALTNAEVQSILDDEDVKG